VGRKREKGGRRGGKGGGEMDSQLLSNAILRSSSCLRHRGREEGGGKGGRKTPNRICGGKKRKERKGEGGVTGILST